MKKDKIPSQGIISRDPFPASRKIYVKGKLHDISVAMREISLADTHERLTGKIEKNPPVPVYDTSGPYTDPEVEINVKKGTTST